MLLDKNGNNFVVQVEFESFNCQLSVVNCYIGSKLVNVVQQDVYVILQQGEVQIVKVVQGLIDVVCNEVDEKLMVELLCLEVLKVVNLNICDDELVGIESNCQQVMDVLVQVGWCLDVLCLIVVIYQ